MKGHVEAWVLRALAMLSYAAVMMTVWDGWWHRIYPSKELNIPPHWGLYTAALVGLLISILGYRHSNHARRWLWSIVSWLMLLVVAPIDRWFTHTFQVGKPYDIWTIWHPLHFAVAGALIIVAVSILHLFATGRSTIEKRAFGSLAFAAILYILLGLATPFLPTSVYALAGFWGAGVSTIIFSVVMLRAEHWMGRGFAVATPIGVLMLVLQAIGSYQPSALTADVPVVDVVPMWMLTFLMLITCVVFDATRSLPSWSRAMLATACGSGLFYLTVASFLPMEFKFPLIDGLYAVISAVIGAGLAGYFEGFVKGRSQK